MIELCKTNTSYNLWGIHKLSNNLRKCKLSQACKSDSNEVFEVSYASKIFCDIVLKNIFWAKLVLRTLNSSIHHSWPAWTQLVKFKSFEGLPQTQDTQNT